MSDGRRRSGKRAKPRKKPGTTIIRSPLNGAELVAGNPGNSGGKKGRSGRWPTKLHGFLAKLRDHPEFHDELYAAATDRDSRGFAPLVKHLLAPDELTVVHPDVQLRLQQQVQLLASRASWDTEELMQKLSDIWNPTKAVEPTE